MASGGLLSLKWNNHNTTFFHVLSTIRSKEAYCDATIACDGRFYPVHKLVMSTCSDYFEEMFERTNCKHPVIVLKDIRHEDLEALLNYMYVGEVNVLQNELAGLIKAAECLMIKGLAVPDEAPSKDSPKESKRGATKEESPQAKRRRRDDSDSGRYDSGNNSVRSSLQNQSHRESSSSSSREQHSARHSSSASGQSSSFRRPASSPRHTSESLPDDPGTSQKSTQDESFQTNPEKSKSKNIPRSQPPKPVPEIMLDQPSEVKGEPDDEPPRVKAEPADIQEILDEVQENCENPLDSSFSYEHLSDGDSMNNIGDGVGHGFDAQMMSMEDISSQVMPGSSGMQGNSMWESEGSLQGFPAEAFGDNQRQPQMGVNRVNLSSYRIPDKNVRNLEVPRKVIQSPVSYPAVQYPPVRPLHKEQDSQDNKLQCSICGYNALSESKLAIHFRTHTGEKPFVCPYCDHRCANRSNLSSHIKTRHIGFQKTE
ncbi:unnamed protein product, partial [Meganyctiphanes norvegica]